MNKAKVFLIGEVVKKLRWFENKPLFGKRIMVTRSRLQASKLSRNLEKAIVSYFVKEKK